MAIGLSGCMQAGIGDPTDWYASQQISAPKGTTVFICHATDCARRERVTFSSADMSKLKGILARGSGSASSERAAIGKAVQWFEKRVGPQVGSTNDVGGFDFSKVGKPGQMDCIDEATNTTSLLKLAQNRGYLRYHTTGRPAARGFFLDGRYPHATAVAIETTSGTTFAVDSWTRDNGKPPEIMRLDVWMKSRPTGLQGI